MEWKTLFAASTIQQSPRGDCCGKAIISLTCHCLDPERPQETTRRANGPAKTRRRFFLSTFRPKKGPNRPGDSDRIGFFPRRQPHGVAHARTPPILSGRGESRQPPLSRKRRRRAGRRKIADAPTRRPARLPLDADTIASVLVLFPNYKFTIPVCFI